MGTSRKYTKDLLAGGNRPTRTPDEILVVIPWGSRRVHPELLTPALVESGVPYESAACRNPGSWLGAPLKLDVDHIDGDFHNNQKPNLRFLCPNCHRQTPNFAGRSRGRFADEMAPVGSTGTSA